MRHIDDYKGFRRVGGDPKDSGEIGMTYEYECKNGHRFEEQAPISKKPRTRCKVCRCKCQRLINSGGFVLKGKGWAKDGYASKS